MQIGDLVIGKTGGPIETIVSIVDSHITTRHDKSILPKIWSIKEITHITALDVMEVICSKEERK